MVNMTVDIVMKLHMMSIWRNKNDFISTIKMVYCGTPSPDWFEYRDKYLKTDFFKLANSQSGTETLYLDTRWVVMYATPEQRISTENVRDCHRMLNEAFGARNTEELEKVPDTTEYPFKGVIGNPNIQFLPLNHHDLKVQYMSIDSELDGDAPVSDAANRADITDGVLNIYVSSSESGMILGQAELSSNIVYALYSAVGGTEVPGKLNRYNLGKTVIHEVGHALGLVHTFADTQCHDGIVPYPDIPEQQAPNFDGIIQFENGVYVGKNDNRYKDRTNGTSLSCWRQGDQENEMFFNYMDYGDDSVSIMFSKSQCAMMRAFLQSPENQRLVLKQSNDTSVSSGGGSFDLNSSSINSDTTRESMILYIVIAAASALLIFAVVWKIRKSSKTGNHKSKRMNSSSLNQQ
jgi:hypothetical protein